VVGGQFGFGFDSDEQWRPTPRRHTFSWEMLALESQSKRSFLQEK